MEEKPERNHELEPPEIFSVFNNYFLLFFGVTCVLSSVFVQQLFYVMGQVHLGIILGPVLGIILPLYIVARRFLASFHSQFLIRKPRALTVIYVTVATFAVVVIVDFVYILSQMFMPPPVEYIEGLKTLKPTGTTTIIGTFFGLCVVVPLAEEIVFRGVIQRVFSRNMNEVLAFVLAGVFFGVIHLTPQLMLSMVVFGVFLGYLFYATSNLTYPILAHCILNSVAFYQLMLTSDDEVISNPFYTGSYWILGASVAVLFFLLIKIKKGDSVLPKAPHSRSGSPDYD